MDLNRPGPSRRHVSSSQSNVPPPNSGSNQMHSSYFMVDDDDGLKQQPPPVTTNQIPNRPPSIPPSVSSANNNNNNPSPFNSFNNNTPFFSPINDNFGSSQPPLGQPPPPPLWQTPNQSGPVNFGGPNPQQRQPDGASLFANQQFLMQAGQQLLSNPVTAAAIGAYSQTLVDKSQGWIGTLKQYFAVDTNYAMKKLLLIFLPFLHKDWSIRYNTEMVAPRDEPNLPDLYIPSMAFITYILVSGYILGLRNQFQPEQLGIYASSALAWLILEVFLIFIAKYSMNLSNSFGFLHMIAFGGYKFVCVDALLIISVIFGRNAYLLLFFYASLSLGYFLIRALSTNLQQSPEANYQNYNHNPRTAYYLVIFIAFLQPFIMYFLTSSLTHLTTKNINHINDGINITM